MASVTSLDKDLRKLRLDKYTPGAVNEARTWIEGILGERLSGDLMEALKDGTILCRLVNLAVPPPGIKFKQSAMPFVQMENISHFLRACKSPPLNLQEHDMFLTVDLYEQKDPAQVLQCLNGFSRAANQVAPANFPTAIGPKNRSGLLSPQSTGPGTASPPRGRGMSTTSNTSSLYGTPRPVLTASKTGDSNSGRWSPTKSPTKSPTNDSNSPGVSVSSWSRKEHEGATAPAWNISQYGYMGGASQGNLGISFGGRRQITSAGPYVPNMADKERRRKEQEAEEERQRQQMEEEERQRREEEERRRREEQEAEELRARLEEERRWEEETRRQREQERRKAEEERRRWEEEERMWKITEEKRRKEEDEAQARLEEERRRARSRTRSNTNLRGQYLSEYQADHGVSQDNSDYSNRIRELEKELELARQREQEYERERQERSRQPVPTTDEKARARSRSRPRPVSRQDSWSKDEREYLRTQWNQRQEPPPSKLPSHSPAKSPRPLPDPTAVSTPTKVKTHRTGDGASSPTKSPRIKTHRTGDGPNKLVKAQRTGEKVKTHHTGGSRPLPDPTAYAPQPAQQPRYAGNPPPQTQSRGKPAGGWGSKSLLEREMEMERQRQREWEEAQKETANAVRLGNGVDGIGGGVGGRWDVSQWSGYTGGDGQNKGGQGIGAGRRQIVGPRPLPGSGR